MAVGIGDVFVNVVPNMAAFTEQVDAGVTAAATGAEAKMATATESGVAAGATAASESKGILGKFGGLAKLAAGLFAFEFGKHSIEAFDSYEAGVLHLKTVLEKNKMADALPNLEEWTKSFSKSSGIAQTSLLDMEKRLVAFGLTGTQKLEDVTNAAYGLSQMTGKSVGMFTRSLIPSIINSPAAAMSMFLKLHIATADQLVGIQKLIDANKTQAASQAMLNLFIQKGKDIYKSTPLEKFKNDMKNLQIFIGSKLVPVLDVLLKGLMAVFAFFESSNPVIKTLATSVIALVGAFLAFKTAMKVIEEIKAMGAAMKAFNLVVMANPWVAIAAAVIVVAVLIITHWQTVKEFLLKVWDVLKAAGMAVWNVIKAVAAPVIAFIQTAVGVMVKVWVIEFNVIKAIVMAVFNAIKTAVMVFVRLWMTEFNIMKYIVMLTIILAAKLVIAAWNAVKGPVIAVFNAIKTVANVVFNFIKKIATTVKNAVLAAWRPVEAFFKKIFTAVKVVATIEWNAIKAVVVAVWTAVKAAWTAAVGFFKSLWSSISGPAKTMWHGIQTLVTGVVDAIKAAWNSVTGVVTTVWNSVVGAAKTALNFLIRIWDDTIGRIAHGQSIGVGPLHVTLPNLYVAPLAEGAIVTKPTLALVGDNRREAEAVIPLSKVGKLAEDLGETTRRGDTFNISVTGSESPLSHAASLVRTMRRMQRLHSRVLTLPQR